MSRLWSSPSLLAASLLVGLSASAATWERWNRVTGLAESPIFSGSLPTPQSVLILPLEPHYTSSVLAPAIPLQADSYLWGHLPFFVDLSESPKATEVLYCDGIFLGELPTDGYFLPYDGALVQKENSLWHFPEGVAPECRAPLQDRLNTLPLEEGVHHLSIQPAQKKNGTENGTVPELIRK